MLKVDTGDLIVNYCCCFFFSESFFTCCWSQTADAVLFTAADVVVDESSFTGETKEVKKQAGPGGVKDRFVYSEHFLFFCWTFLNFTKVAPTL